MVLPVVNNGKNSDATSPSNCSQAAIEEILTGGFGRKDYEHRDAKHENSHARGVYLTREGLVKYIVTRV